MADRRRHPIPLDLSAPDVLAALDAAPEFDTSTLIGLCGRWADGQAMIAWNPKAILIDDAARAALRRGQSSRISLGWLAFDEPRAWLAECEQLLRQDATGRWWLETDASVPEPTATMAALAQLRPPRPADFFLPELKITERNEHLAAVERAISAIRAGQLYQINVCARVHGRIDGSPLDLFRAGVHRFHPDYAGFIRHRDQTIVSLSPERFLEIADGRVSSSPIKGTRRRATPGNQIDPAVPDPAVVDLLHSTKDRAENIMIVDLMRNDLARVCRPGTVTTPMLLDVRAASGVWHLVSEVTGQLATVGGRTVSVGDIIDATFPPGSVTGAPKIRALSLIGDLEAERRALFTGAIGYRLSDQQSEWSVAIRTFEFEGRDFALGVGGGITADSVPILEWQECLVKAEPLLGLTPAWPLPSALTPALSAVPDVVDIEQGIFDSLLVRDGTAIGLADHLTRLESSCQEVLGLRLPTDLAERIQRAVADSELSGAPRLRVRTVVRPQGGTVAEPEISVLADPPGQAPISLVTTVGRTGSWRHKWNDRRYLAQHERESQLPLFSNGKLAYETSRSNIAIVTAAGLIATPTLTDEVLPGVTRRRFLDGALDRLVPVEIRDVQLSEIRRARLVLSLNASGIRPVLALDGHPLGVDDRLLEKFLTWGC